MTYVVTRLCRDCLDGSCVSVCPCDCILEHRPSAGQSTLPRQLFIDPDECIDCSMCVTECPWQAIYADVTVPEALRDDIELNALSRDRSRFFAPALEQKPRPTPDEVDANKEKWLLRDVRRLPLAR